MRNFRIGLMRLSLTSAFALMPFCADAADIYPASGPGYKDAPVSNSWTGIYLGIQGGGAWGTQSITVPGVSDSINLDGGLFGGQIGALYQFHNNFVLGAEVSGLGAFSTGSAACPNPAYTCHAKVNDIVEVVGRLGYSLGDILPYVRGGYANTSQSSTVTPPYAGFNESQSHNGWVLGGGVDFALKHNIVIGFEFSHIETDSVTYSSGVFGAQRNIDAELTTLTAHVNYKFANDYVPLK